jgi:acetyltransferase-like isoleucine patch superfamily enzyme
MLVLGFPGTVGQSNCITLLSIEHGGRLIVSENVQMARGTRIIIGNQGVMQIGEHFWCNGDCFFNCTTKISIGDNNMYGWNISFNTTDGHHVYDNGVMKPMEGDITISNHVWIASNCHIAKNTFIADDCVVAQQSLVGKRFEQPKCLIGGIPAKLLKDNITWSA